MGCLAMAMKLVGVNELGQRVGEDHPRARLTNHEVDLIRELGDELDHRGRRKWGRRKLSEKFEVSTWTIQSILECRSRAQYPAQFKRVEVAPKQPVVVTSVIAPGPWTQLAFDFGGGNE